MAKGYVEGFVEGMKAAEKPVMMKVCQIIADNVICKNCPASKYCEGYHTLDDVGCVDIIYEYVRMLEEDRCK